MTRARFTYVKVDDQLPESDKLDGLPLLTRLVLVGSLVDCWAYCNRNQTDGYISANRWGKLGNALGRRLMLERRFAEPVDGGYEMRHYLRYNHSREQIAAMVEQRRKAGAKGGAAKQAASGSLSGPVSNSVSDSLSGSVGKEEVDVNKTPLPPARGASGRASGAAPRGAGRAPTSGDRPPPASSLCRRCGGPHGTRYCPTLDGDGDGEREPGTRPPLRSVGRPPDEVATRGAERARELLGRRPEPAAGTDDDIPF